MDYDGNAVGGDGILIFSLRLADGATGRRFLKFKLILGKFQASQMSSVPNRYTLYSNFNIRAHHSGHNRLFLPRLFPSFQITQHYVVLEDLCPRPPFPLFFSIFLLVILGHFIQTLPSHTLFALP